MGKDRRHYGFSLMEVLLAVGTLSIGMIFVAGVFPVAIHFSTIATERTIAAVVADEAFAKVRLFGINPDALQSNQSTPLTSLLSINPDEFAYPSYDNADILQSRYCWSALCRRVGTEPASRLVQITVFVSRKIGAGNVYWLRNQGNTPLGTSTGYPVPILVSVSAGSNPNELIINDVDPTPGTPEETFINDDYTIVDNATGRLYRVLERDRTQLNRIILDSPWQGGSPAWVWVVPPPKNGGRYPCIAVYQKVIRF